MTENFINEYATLKYIMENSNNRIYLKRIFLSRTFWITTAIFFVLNFLLNIKDHFAVYSSFGYFIRNEPGFFIGWVFGDVVISLLLALLVIIVAKVINLSISKIRKTFKS